MNLNGIYTLCNYIANKNKSGNAFTINQFNSLLEILVPDFFKKKVEESGYFETRGLVYSDPLRGSKLLKEFIVNEVVVNGGALTYDFAYILGAHDSDNDTLIEDITETEYHDRIGDSVMSASSFLVIRDGAIDIYPVTIANINISYYRFPETSFLDYYIDVNGVIQFLAVGASHVWATGEIDSSGTAHTLGDPNWASLTEELEFDEDMHNDLLNEILSRVGIRLKEPQLTQYAEALKSEQKLM